ncbi:4-hydroxyproline epimerase [bacterium]|nr:MAG: 4-hydroxyproline epimerase [bacterium]
MNQRASRISVVDSHSGGEPTRVIVEGGPDLGSGSMAERLARFREAFDDVRSATVNEPRGADPVVGALLCAPSDPSCTAGVIFFNNVGYLGMCGHGTIGMVTTLAYLGRIGPGLHRIETPVGVVGARLHEDGRVAVANVASYRAARHVRVDVPGHGAVHGDVAYGGNWFFLVEDHEQELRFERVEALTAYAWSVRQGLEAAGIAGPDGEVIDHIELFTSPGVHADSRNFVLCPGKAYDRSPCGTGTSAKLACLHAEGMLAPSEVWRQESIVGSIFEASYELREGVVYPTITGSAYVTAEATLVLDERDPFRWGIRP